jgi:CHRD domain
MKKPFMTLAVVALVGAAGLAIAALAGATPGKDQGQSRANPGGKADRQGKSRANRGGKAERVLFALLKGRKEIGQDGRRGAGDRDGRGGFTALVANGQVCFGLTVDNIAAPAAAHIHRGRRSQNGAIVVTLSPPSSGDPGASSGCVAPDAGNTTVLREILKHPNHFYVNVHTGDFPNGAIRGQLKHRRP